MSSHADKYITGTLNRVNPLIGIKGGKGGGLTVVGKGKGGGTRKVGEKEKSGEGKGEEWWEKEGQGWERRKVPEE